MHSVWLRANIVLMHAMVFALFVVVCTQVSNQLVMKHAPAKAEFDNIRVARLKGTDDRDKLVLMFEGELDLTPLFDWNTKQIFAFIEMSYSTEWGPTNRIIAWDKVFHSKDEAKLVFPRQQLVKYELEDIGLGLFGNDNVTLRLGWDVMPYIGFLGKGSQLHVHPLGKQFTVGPKYGSFLIQ